MFTSNYYDIVDELRQLLCYNWSSAQIVREKWRWTIKQIDVYLFCVGTRKNAHFSEKRKKKWKFKQCNKLMMWTIFGRQNFVISTEHCLILMTSQFIKIWFGCTVKDTDLYFYFLYRHMHNTVENCILNHFLVIVI